MSCNAREVKTEINEKHNKHLTVHYPIAYLPIKLSMYLSPICLFCNHKQSALVPCLLIPNP